MPLLSKGVARAQAVMQRKQERGVTLLGVELRDTREELFVSMVCDGLAMGIAFRKAGFTSKDNAAPSRLFALPRIQQRAAAILDARRKQAAVTLPEVTGMLQRVFSKALHDDQMNAAHNAAFSLARLYGHVTDRAVVDVLRKPSRDPDAPAERSLTNWIDNLPLKAIEGPSPEGPQIPLPEAAFASSRPAIEQGSGLASEGSGPEGSGLKFSAENFSSPEGSSPRVDRGQLGEPVDGPRQSGNGAPVGPVTGTPPTRGQSPVLAVSRETKVSPPAIRKREQKRNKVPVLSGAQKRKRKRMKELFG